VSQGLRESFAELAEVFMGPDSHGPPTRDEVRDGLTREVRPTEPDLMSGTGKNISMLSILAQLLLQLFSYSASFLGDEMDFSTVRERAR
jgi:hypothetical protein